MREGAGGGVGETSSGGGGGGRGKGRDCLFLGGSLARKVCLLLYIYLPMAPSLSPWPLPSYLGTTTMTTSSSYGRMLTSGMAS